MSNRNAGFLASSFPLCQVFLELEIEESIVGIHVRESPFLPKKKKGKKGERKKGGPPVEISPIASNPPLFFYYRHGKVSRMKQMHQEHIGHSVTRGARGCVR